MASIRETIQAEINAAQAELSAKTAELANLEATAPSFLSAEMDTVKAFFASIAHRLGL